MMLPPFFSAITLAWSSHKTMSQYLRRLAARRGASRFISPELPGDDAMMAFTKADTTDQEGTGC